MYPGEFPSRENVVAFLALPRAKATAVVLDYCRRAGIHKPMSPHKMRHSAITAALGASRGNVRRLVQRLSRHAKLETLQRYDDNWTCGQSQVTELLAALVREGNRWWFAILRFKRRQRDLGFTGRPYTGGLVVGAFLFTALAPAPHESKRRTWSAWRRRPGWSMKRRRADATGSRILPAPLRKLARTDEVLWSPERDLWGRGAA